jgi:valyl-tRNA synthetase
VLCAVIRDIYDILKQAEEDALAADLRAQLQKLGDASRLVDKEMQHAQMEYQRLSNQMQTVDATAAAASAKLTQSKKDMVQALRTFSDLEAVQAEASQQVSQAKPNTSGPAATLPGTPCADVDAEVLRLSKQAQRLQAQLRRLPAIDMPQAQQVPHVQVK